MSFITYDSKISVLKIADSAGTLRDLSKYVTAFDGLPGTITNVEVTTITQSTPGRQYKPGSTQALLLLDCLYSDEATLGTDTVLYPLYSGRLRAAFEYYPVGTAVGKPKFTGYLRFDDYKIRTERGQKVGISAIMRVDGDIARTIVS